MSKSLKRSLAVRSRCKDSPDCAAFHAHPHRRPQGRVAVSRGQAGGLLQVPVRCRTGHQDQGAGDILHVQAVVPRRFQGEDGVIIPLGAAHHRLGATGQAEMATPLEQLQIPAGHPPLMPQQLLDPQGETRVRQQAAPGGSRIAG